ncbi:unnamed protein product [Closterium sp. Naga37s-1]|nr:unnamed protein product [Closterium sp. Naga37s-1]
MAEASQTAAAAAVSSPATGLRVFRLADLAEDDVAQLLTRPRIDFTSIFSTSPRATNFLPPPLPPPPRSIPLLLSFHSRYTERFDRVKLDDVVVRVAELPDPEIS